MRTAVCVLAQILFRDAKVKKGQTKWKGAAEKEWSRNQWQRQKNDIAHFKSLGCP